MRQYEMAEISVRGRAPEGSEAQADLAAVIRHGGKEIRVKGFYAGKEEYRVRFLPEEAGEYAYTLTGSVLEAPVEGKITVLPGEGRHHGPVRAEGTHLRHADGKWFTGFGTTVYALVHQSDALMEETFRTLAESPFNKVRMCLFPKHYNYNHNNPKYYPFARSPKGEGLTFDAEEGSQVAGAAAPEDTKENNWDVHHPCFEYWDALEEKLTRLEEMGIQADLILFHPYDRWGFSFMPQGDNLVYLDYALRRLAAFPNVWWSLANEYDLCAGKTLADWEEIETFVAENDPFHHLLSNHNCFRPWDWSRPNTTHVSWQSKQMYRVAQLMRTYGKPVLFDECRYEGNLPEAWGNISGEEMTRRFWQVTVLGGHCTHGETFYPGTEAAKENTHTGESEVVWWARGGRLHGESPRRIAFLRQIVEELPGPLEPAETGLSSMMGMTDEEVQAAVQQVPEAHRHFVASFAGMPREERDRFLAVEFDYTGRAGDGEAFLCYKDTECCAETRLQLPQDKTYRVEVIDTWNMTRQQVMTGAKGQIRVKMPGRLHMAILAVKE